MSPPNRLIAAELSASLGESVIGRRIIVLESTRSTNDFLLQMLTPELPEGFVVFAEHQTAGRGQRGHRWESAPHQGLWFSVLLQPRIPSAESARLTTWAAQAIANAIRRETGLEPVIKPPNDVHVSGRKVAGVLVETKGWPRPVVQRDCRDRSEHQSGAGRILRRASHPRRLARHGAWAEDQPRGVCGCAAARTGADAGVCACGNSLAQPESGRAWFRIQIVILSREDGEGPPSCNSRFLVMRKHLLQLPGLRWTALDPLPNAPCIPSGNGHSPESISANHCR